MNLNQSAYKTTASKKIISLAAIALFVMCTSAVLLYDHANFSGSWALNEQKSDLGEMGARIAAKKLMVDQTADAISIERHTSFNGEERTSNEKLTFDGKESESTVFNNAKKKSSAKWSEDGQTMNVNSVINLERNGEQIEIKVTENWKTIDNGQALSVESTSTSTWGTNTVKAVYDKAK